VTLRFSGFPTKLAAFLAAAVITVGCVLLLVPANSFTSLWTVLAAADPLSGALAVMCSLVANLARGWRLSVVVAPDRRPDRTAFRISAVHIFLSQVMPMRTGELSLVVLLRRAYGSSILSATGVLVGLRLFELCLVCGFGGFAAALVLPAEGTLGALRWPLAAGGGSFLGVLMPMPWLVGLGRRVGHLLEGIACGRPARFWQQVTEGFVRMSGSALIQLQGLMLVIWAGLFCAAYFSTVAVGAGMGVGAVAVAVAAASIAFALPLNGLGQVGPFEAAFVLAAGAAGGIAREPALAAALLIHLVGFLVAGGLALVVVAIPSRGGRGKPGSHTGKKRGGLGGRSGPPVGGLRGAKAPRIVL